MSGSSTGDVFTGIENAYETAKDELFGGSTTSSDTADWASGEAAATYAKLQEAIDALAEYASNAGNGMVNTALYNATQQADYADYEEQDQMGVEDQYAVKGTDTEELEPTTINANEYTQPSELAQSIFTDLGVGDEGSTSSDEALFDLAARRFREETLPTYSARGLTTSGPGITAETEGLQDLAILFSENEFERAATAQELQTAIDTAQSESNIATYEVNTSAVNDWYNSLTEMGIAQSGADIGTFEANTENTKAINDALAEQYDLETQREAEQAASDAERMKILDDREEAKVAAVQAQSELTIQALAGAAELQSLAVDDQNALLSILASIINGGTYDEASIVEQLGGLLKGIGSIAD